MEDGGCLGRMLVDKSASTRRRVNLKTQLNLHDRLRSSVYTTPVDFVDFSKTPARVDKFENAG